MITTSTVVNSVVEKLRAALARGQWRSGEMLPGQRELAEQLGISRPSLREAVIVLETLGLVRSMPGKGVVVLDAQLSDNPNHDSAVAGASLEDVLQLRYTLEPFIVGLVAQSISSKEVGQLRLTLMDMREALEAGDSEAGVSAYIAFHEGLKRRWAPAFFALLLVYLGVSLASHLLFNVQDVYGLTCVESAATRTLGKGENSGPIRFNTSDLCKPTGIMAEKGARYLVEIKPVSGEPWSDDGIPVPLGGFSAANPPVWYHRLLLAAAVPLRREITQDWFHVVLRYGRVGGEETFIVPDPDDYLIQSPIRATRDGEIFVFVNDAVIGIPGLYDWFYRNNRGAADLVITRR